jgi:hypothetical protein
MIQISERELQRGDIRRARVEGVTMLPVAEVRGMAVVDYWYVRARQVSTGREIQRIAPARGDGYGLGNAATAVEDMRRFLVSAGLATDGAEPWEIVEVHRFGESPSRR